MNITVLPATVNDHQQQATMHRSIAKKKLSMQKIELKPLKTGAAELLCKPLTSYSRLAFQSEADS